MGSTSLGLGAVTQAVREGDSSAWHRAFWGGGGLTDTLVPPQSPGVVWDPSPLPRPLSPSPTPPHQRGEQSAMLPLPRRPWGSKLLSDAVWVHVAGRLGSLKGSWQPLPTAELLGGLVAHWRFPPAGSGDSSLEKEFSAAIVGPAVSTPNSQHSSPSRSLSGEYKHCVCPQTCTRSAGTEALASSKSHSLFSNG